MASPDKIGNRRGQDKWFSDAELERWAEAHRPVGVGVRPAQGLGVVEPEHDEAEEVHPDRAAPAAEWRAHGLGVLVARSAPDELGVRVPGESCVVEDGALDWGKPDRQESEHQAAGQREAHLGVRHREPRPDELVELGATAGRRREALVVDERAGGVAAHQVGVPEELWEQVAVPSEAAKEHAAQGEREGSGEEVATPVDQAGGELPRAEARRDLQPPARARERSHEPEQRGVVDPRELRPVVADGRAAPRHRVLDAQHRAGAAIYEAILPQRVLGDVREVAADLYAGKPAEWIVPLREYVADHEALEPRRGDRGARVRGGLDERRRIEVQRFLRAAD